jgi:diacylglycerol kinase (ATP)
MRCEWCGITTHSTCRSRVPEECGFGTLRDIIIPPYAISIPRIADLNKDLILGIGNNMSKPIQNITSQLNNSGGLGSDYPINTGLDYRTGLPILRSSSTENICIGDVDLGGSGGIERDPSSRGAAASSSPNVQIESVSNKQRRDKIPNKGQQDEEEEREIIRVYDGNATFRNGTPRSISVPKQATYTQILEAALRTFHINDDSTKYCLTVPKDEVGGDQPLDETMPLKFLKQLCGRKPNIFIRYRERGDMDCDYVRVYPGILKTHDYFKVIKVTSSTTTSEVIAKALSDFGLTNVTAEKYSLAEVLLISNVNYTDRILEPNEYPLNVLRQQRKESVRSHRVTRFYLQHKDDPHGPSVSLFVGNLPPGPRTEKQYEKILFQDIFKSNKDLKWDNMEVIYYEHGAMVLVYNDSDRATRAYSILRQAHHDQKQLLVLMLPNIQSQSIPSNISPLLVFVNVKSGGQQGADLITNFRHLLNPHQVFDLQNGGPLPGLYVFRNIPHYRILACGGDGTVGWVLSCLDNVGQDAMCQSPPVGIVPLGTGNDLARVLRWGSGYTGGEEPLALLRDMVDAEEIKLDRWTVVFHQDQDKRVPTTVPELTTSSKPSTTTTATKTDEKKTRKPTLNAPPPAVALPISLPEGSTSEDKTEMFVMNNYFGLGLDADICLDFHMAREENPNKFNSRIQAKGYYLKTGLKKMMKKGGLKDFTRDIVLEVDGKRVDLPSLEGIVIMNILSWASGANLWGHEKDEKFNRPTHYDGMLEVVGVTSIVHLGQIQSGIRSGVRLAQGGHVHIRMNNDYPVPVQVDGEPWLQPPCDITIIRSALKATMLRKRKSKIKRRNTEPSVYFPDIDDDSKG